MVALQISEELAETIKKEATFVAFLSKLTCAQRFNVNALLQREQKLR
jgi:hypothetical protein